MKTIEKFVINKSSSIEILVPELADKFNYYYQPTKELNKFDEVIVVFKDDQKEVVVGSDMADLVFGNLKDILVSVLEDEKELISDINIGKVGYHYNIDTKKLSSDLTDYAEYSLWSGKLLPTWLYKKNKKIYLEISPKYPWLFEEPKKGEAFISFEEFMRSYKSIAVEEIDKAVAREWLSKCDKIIQKLEESHSAMLQQIEKNKE